MYLAKSAITGLNPVSLSASTKYVGVSLAPALVLPRALDRADFLFFAWAWLAWLGLAWATADSSACVLRMPYCS